MAINWDDVESQAKNLDKNTSKKSLSPVVGQKTVLEQQQEAEARAEALASLPTGTATLVSPQERLQTVQDSAKAIQTATEQKNAAENLSSNLQKGADYLQEKVKAGTATRAEQIAYDAVKNAANQAIASEQVKAAPKTAVNIADSFITSGGKQALGGLYGLLGAADEFATQNLLGNKDYESPFTRTAQDELSMSAQRLEENSAGSGWLGRKANELAASAGNMALTGLIGGTAAAGLGLMPGATAAASNTASAASNLANSSTASKLAQAASQIGNKTIASVLENAGLYTMGASAAGASAVEAKASGADSGEALAYGLLSGAAEAASEKLFGGNPLFDQNAGLVNKILGKVIKNEKVMDFLGSKGAETFGEGLEEVVTAALSPVFQRLTYDPTADTATLEELADSFVSGVVLSGVMQGASAGINAVSRTAGEIQAARDARQQTEAASGLMPGAAAQTTTAANSGLMPGAMLETPTAAQSIETARVDETALPQTNAVQNEQQNLTEATAQAPVTQADQSVTGPVLQGVEQNQLLENGQGAMAEANQANRPGNTTLLENEVPIEDRGYDAAGNRKTTSYQYNHPELHPYYVDAAKALRYDLQNSVRGERFAVKQDGSITGWAGQNRMTSESVAKALDDAKISYADLDKAITAIINDQGQENYAAAKKVEIILDDMLANGYTDITGEWVAPDTNYIQARDAISGNTTDISGYTERPGARNEYLTLAEQDPRYVVDVGNEAFSSLDAQQLENLLNTYKIRSGNQYGDTDYYYYRDILADAYSGRGENTALNSAVQSAVEKVKNDSLGSARLGFDPVSNWQNQKSDFYETGENAFRDVQMPTTDLSGRNVSRSVRTVTEAQTMPEDMAQMILEEAANGAFSYDPVTDAGAIRRAEKTITKKGYDGALEYFRNAAMDGVISKDLVVLGGTLLNNAANSGDGKAVAEILALYSSMGKTGAQVTQAQRVFKKLSPQWQLYGIQQSVDNLQEALNKRYQPKGKDAPEISIDKDLVDQFLNAKDQDGRDAAMEAIYQNVADQVPSTFVDKWNAWRYLAMLFNPRTHDRNILGNVWFQPFIFTKNRVASAIESTVDAVSKANGGKGIERTKSFVYSPSLFKAAWGDYTNAKEMLSGSKYGETFQGKINEKRRIFKNRVLETLRKGNSAALELEDLAFKRVTYAGSLAGYLNTRGVTAEQLRSGNVSTELLDKARAYAANEALKATYQDSNSFSDFVSQIGSFAKHSDNKTAKAASAFVEGVLPFKRTPANIVVRTAEYSPLGLAKGLTSDLVKVAKGQKTASEAIDQIASGLTGSALFAAGAWLAANGILSGGGSGDEKQDQFDELNGAQNYALNLPDGTSVTLDWLAPESITLFMGAEFANALMENGKDPETIIPAMFEALGSAANPLLEMSMLQSLNDIIDSAAFSDDKLAAVAYSAATSYFTQAIPTILGQAERSGQGERMTTYTSNANALPSDLQYVIGQASARLPGWDYQQIPYIDAWGRTESSGTLPTRIADNFLNPAYVDQYSTTETDDELQRLYDAGESSVFPSRADKYFNVNGERVDLKADQYQTYATQKGQVSRSLVEEIMRTRAYQNADDATRAKLIESVYDYANQKAKAAVSGFDPESWVKEAESYSGGVAEYIGYKRAKSDTVDYISIPSTEGKFEYAKSLMEDNELTPEKRTELYTSMFGGDDVPDFSSKEAFYVSSMGSKAADNWGAASQSGISIEDYYAASKVSGTVEEKLAGLEALGYSQSESWWLYAMLNYKDAGELSSAEIAKKIQTSIKNSQKQ